MPTTCNKSYILKGKFYMISSTAAIVWVLLFVSYHSCW